VTSLRVGSSVLERQTGLFVALIFRGNYSTAV